MLFYSLVVLFIGIWGTVIYRLVGGFAPGAPVSVPAAADSSAHGAPVQAFMQVAFEPVRRDPFLPPDTFHQPAEQGVYTDAGPGANGRHRGAGAAAGRQGARLPRILLRGIVNQTALLEDSSRTIHFAHAGDRVVGTYITAIHPDNITVSHEDTTYTLTLAP